MQTSRSRGVRARKPASGRLVALEKKGRRISPPRNGSSASRSRSTSPSTSGKRSRKRPASRGRSRRSTAFRGEYGLAAARDREPSAAVARTGEKGRGSRRQADRGPVQRPCRACDARCVLWAVVGRDRGGVRSAFVGVLALIGALAARGGFTFRAVRRRARHEGRQQRVAPPRADARARGVVAARALDPARQVQGRRPQNVTIGVALLYTLVLAIFVAGAVWAWLHPSRGIQDRIAGTWIVPR